MILESLWRAAQPANWRRSDHTIAKGKSPVPEPYQRSKWQEVSIDFIRDLPTASRGMPRTPCHDSGGSCYQDGALDPV